MSECLHCDILDMLQSRHQGKEADLAEVAANVTQVLADLILMAPPDEHCLGQEPSMPTPIGFGNLLEDNK